MAKRSREQPSAAPKPGRRAPLSPGPLRVVIVEDHPLARRGLATLIEHDPGMTVCGEGDTVASGLERIGREHPDVAVIDLTLGLESGLGIVKRLSVTHPEVRILILSMHDETLYAERALAAGAHGYIMKDEAAPHVLEAIRAVASGRTYVSRAMAERIIARVGGRHLAAGDAPPEASLTDREREVFSLVGQGLETRAIAGQLRLSVKTIETYYARIKEKLGLKNGHELIRAAVEWIRP